MDQRKVLTAEVCRKLRFIRGNLDRTALLLGIAEEAAEVIQAAMKVSRAFRDVFNPTPVTLEEAEKVLKDELKDLLLVLFVSEIDIEALLYESLSEDNAKIDRWVERIKKAKREAAKGE